MTTYDAAMVIVVVLGMLRGAWRGFTWQVASITSLVLGYTAAHTASARVASYLPGEPEVQRMLAMGVVYVAVSGGIFAIAWMIRGTLRKLKFEAYDRHLGMLLGGLEGVGVGILATMFVVSLAPAHPATDLLQQGGPCGGNGDEQPGASAPRRGSQGAGPALGRVVLGGYRRAGRRPMTQARPRIRLRFLRRGRHIVRASRSPARPTQKATSRGPHRCANHACAGAAGREDPAVERAGGSTQSESAAWSRIFAEMGPF